MKDVFVTYSWDSPEHEEIVISFTNELRKNGFEAEVDKMLIQSETSLDFSKMMHRALTDYKFVLIVLSSKYKQKAEAFRGGVGNEYSMIIKDIENNPNKYILTSFNGISNQITPLALQGKEVLDLSNGDGLRKLFYKLKSIKPYHFDEVALKTPDLQTQITPNFLEIINIHPLEITSFNSVSTSSMSRSGVYANAQNSVSIEIKNVSNKPITEYNIELSIPSVIGFKYNTTKTSGEHSIITLPENHKLFPGQSFITDSFDIEVNYSNYQIALDANIIVNIYTDSGQQSKLFRLSEYFNVGDQYGFPMPLHELRFGRV